MENISAIILAAGQGKRMRSELPKVLHHVCGAPLVLLALNALKKAGIKKIVVVVGVGGDLVRKILPQDVEVVDQGTPLGTGHAVSCTRDLFSGFKGDLVVACGDMPLVRPETVRKLIKKHKKESASCTVLTGILDEPFGYGRIVRDKNNRVAEIREEKDSTDDIKKIKEVNSGMYCFKSADLFGVLPSLNQKNNQKEFYLTDTLRLLLENGRTVSAYCAEDSNEILGINSRKDIACANGVMNQWILDDHMANGVTIVDPLTTYIDAKVKIGRDTVINPFTVIEGDVRIGAHCEVGPFSHLRDKTVLKDRAEIGNFVEVKKSTVGYHTKAKHLTYLGDTTIGKKVNIGAGTITANYDGKAKYKTAIRDGVFIGSGTILVAPVTVGKGAITGAGSVVLKNRNVPAKAVVVGVPAKVIKEKNETSSFQHQTSK